MFMERNELEKQAARLVKKASLRLVALKRQADRLSKEVKNENTSRNRY